MISITHFGEVLSPLRERSLGFNVSTGMHLAPRIRGNSLPVPHGVNKKGRTSGAPPVDGYGIPE